MVAAQNCDLSLVLVHLDPVRKRILFRFQLSQPGLLGTAHHYQAGAQHGVVAAWNRLNSREVKDFGSFTNPVDHRGNHAIWPVHRMNQALFKVKFDWNRLPLQVRTISESHGQKDLLLTDVVVLVGALREEEAICQVVVMKLNKGWVIVAGDGVVKRAALLRIRK